MHGREGLVRHLNFDPIADAMKCHLLCVYYAGYREQQQSSEPKDCFHKHFSPQSVGKWNQASKAHCNSAMVSFAADFPRQLSTLHCSTSLKSIVLAKRAGAGQKKNHRGGIHLRPASR
jgi:hypothetical protein